MGRYTADAIGAFAFGRRVLPVDVNIGRVLERSGGEFGPDAAQALFDLGATVCLARVPRCDACPLAVGCPSRGRRYEPKRRQSRFEGSFRERRSRTLRLLALGEDAVAALDGDVIASLERDGLVEIAGDRVRLPV